MNMWGALIYRKKGGGDNPVGTPPACCADRWDPHQCAGAIGGVLPTVGGPPVVFPPQGGSHPVGSPTGGVPHRPPPTGAHPGGGPSVGFPTGPFPPVRCPGRLYTGHVSFVNKSLKEQGGARPPPHKPHWESGTRSIPKKKSYIQAIAFSGTQFQRFIEDWSLVRREEVQSTLLFECLTTAIHKSTVRRGPYGRDSFRLLEFLILSIITAGRLTGCPWMAQKSRFPSLLEMMECVPALGVIIVMNFDCCDFLH
ncbi:hypothetical protein Taro_033753 [Colocasia esculenta]|uniref:Uncharacterized protein n=1 Tax=Colocasia esculenta TaxID=4460 RepID=A0A843VYT0_COLES|nr:hypothetical protein [Colocasia esculenta]